MERMLGKGPQHRGRCGGVSILGRATRKALTSFSSLQETIARDAAILESYLIE